MNETLSHWRVWLSPGFCSISPPKGVGKLSKDTTLRDKNKQWRAFWNAVQLVAVISAAILGYVVYDNSYKMGAAFGVGTIVGLRLTGGFTHAPCFSWAAILTWEISRMVAIECC